MNGFVCCNCEHRFTETQAETTDVLGWVAYCCPNCGSDDVEDAKNLADIQESKARARESLKTFRSEFDALVSP